MTSRVVGPLLRREKLLVRLVVVFMVLIVAFSGALLYVSASALTARDTTASNSRRRIDLLTDQIRGLQDQVTASAGQRATLIAKVDALSAQVRQLGARPVVENPPSTPTTRPSAAPATATTTTTAPKAPTTTTSTTAPPSTCASAVVSVCTQRASRSKAAAVAVSSDYCGGWLPLVSQYPWPVPTACSVLVCESRGDPAARNPQAVRVAINGQVRYVHAQGLMQILDGPFDPERNIARAYEMWGSRGWAPWKACR